MTSQFDVPILMYHDVQAQSAERYPPYTIPIQLLERQLDYLRDSGRRCIGFDELSVIMEGTQAPTGREVLITFDDGYESFQTLAAPALAERGMSATVFVVTERMGGYNGWDADYKVGYDKKKLMSKEGVREVVAMGMDVGSHSCTHVDLTKCADEEAEGELRRSKQALEELLGKSIEYLAYPFGSYSKSHFTLLEECGYRGAVTIFSGERYVTSNPYAMRRVYVHPGDGPLRFRLKLSRPYLRLLARRKSPEVGLSKFEGEAEAATCS
jgi:peptidoglycan/xylan/chitin deacetylase (PgdA/CDA1 family)